MSGLTSFDPGECAGLTTEPEVSAFADKWLRQRGYKLSHTKSGNAVIDKAWPTKVTKGKGKGKPDMLVCHPDSGLLFCVWENKAPGIAIDVAIDEAKFYIEGLHSKLAAKPGLPRLAAGFNGLSLKLAYYNFDGKWVDVKVSGQVIGDAFPTPEYVINGISANGTFNAVSGMITRTQLRAALPKLKTLYRSIPALASGRKPIDFTVALLTLRMLVESQSNWGTWAEQPALVPDAESIDHAIGERLNLLVRRVMEDKTLKPKYGDIFEFRERSVGQNEVAFNFSATLKQVDTGNGFFLRMFQIIDDLAPLHGADFDLFGEVYQSIGDDATKKALGEFFTGRHIIAAVVPVLFERAGAHSFNSHIDNKRIADIACGTGGFLTETLRYVRRKFNLSDSQACAFAQSAFYGYDLSASNASRARVNMYFAGDGFSAIEGDVDSLAKKDFGTFDYLLTNPPYGSSARYQRLEEAFLGRITELLTPGSGWGLIVLPTGILENPRSAAARLKLIRESRITDIISLPMHAFAPYTKQRTAIIIFQRRSKPQPETNWSNLLQAIGHEEISLFIVDNDGYANSDKRYETSRISVNGGWEHDDLSPWTDVNGVAQPGKLFAAAIQKKIPNPATDEFGTPLGKKYQTTTLSQLAGSSSGHGIDVNLMPDNFLRPSFLQSTLLQFKADAATLIQQATGKIPATISIRDRVRELLVTRIDFGSSGTANISSATVDATFTVHKGVPGLTEAIIYNQFDPAGLPVYGGGESKPKFHIQAKALSKTGIALKAITGPALIVSLDGSSGAVRVVGNQSFVLNHHGCALKLRDGVKLNLSYAAQQLEGALRGLAANTAASATLTLPKLKACIFQLPPSPTTEKDIAKLRQALEEIRDRFS